MKAYTSTYLCNPLITLNNNNNNNNDYDEIKITKLIIFLEYFLWTAI